MMEELDLLKKSWKEEENSFEQVSEKQIYSMLHQKSSSIVKWILIISILEFVFWNVIAFVFSDEKYQVRMKEYGIENIMTVVNMVNYMVVIGFIYVFYKNYKSISTLDSTHQLMKNILSTRRTVQNYIWYNLGVITVTIVISIVLLFYLNPTMISLMQKEVDEGHQGLFICICTAISIVFIGIIIAVFWLFYKLLYGILLKKLFANYNELKKIEL